MSRIDELDARYLSRLIADLVRFGQEPEDAKDIAQETLVGTWKRLDHVPEEAEWAYLVTAAHNLARKRFRRANVPRRGAGLLRQLTDEHDAKDDASSVEAELVKQEEIARFRARFFEAMNALAPATQQALVLKRRGYTSREIAEKLGLTDQAVRTRISRAATFIRERVGQPPPDVPWTELLGDDDDHKE